ncbi:MAG TPA: glycosyltransferase [Solirubrobacterales bacterium]
MARPKFVQIPSHPIERFKPLLGDEYPRVEAAAERARRQLEGQAIWHVSSTLRGGGVAEMLHSLLPYVRGAGLDTRWLVLRERPEFFALTKRLHNNLHCQPGDGGGLGEEERELYEETLAESGRRLTPLLREGDVVFLHDPQTAGLVPAAKAAGATVIWRCHIGTDHPDDTARAAWGFLLPYLRDADVYVFSRREYVWDGLDSDRVRIMAPSIDPFSPKNQDLDPETVTAILRAIGISDGAPPATPSFTRADGTPGRVERDGEVIQEQHLPRAATAVLQVSRWDRLKDHRGLLECFEIHLADSELHLVLAGPETAAVADDPEGAAVWEEIKASRKNLPEQLRRRVHLVSLPMFDLEENAAMVNALQRRADVIVQKSIAEGFGLTVAEAMWKGKPVIGSRVGGIQDQIVDGVSGVLVDPHDLGGVAAAIVSVCGDPRRAAQLGEQARRRVGERFLAATRLAEYVKLVGALSR